MSLRGGYHIVDLKYLPFSSTEETEHKYKDIYTNLLNSNAKFIMISGLNYNGLKYADREAVFYEIDQGFQALLKRTWNTSQQTYTEYFINIMNDDSVVITQETTVYRDTYQKSLTPNSTTNAPTVSAVNKGISDSIQNSLTPNTTTKSASVSAVNSGLASIIQNSMYPLTPAKAPTVTVVKAALNDLYTPCMVDFKLNTAVDGVTASANVYISSFISSSLGTKTPHIHGTINGSMSVDSSIQTFSLTADVISMPQGYNLLDFPIKTHGFMFEWGYIDTSTTFNLIPKTIPITITAGTPHGIHVIVSDVPFYYDSYFKIFF